MVINLPGAREPDRAGHPCENGGLNMAKRGRKKRDRKHNKANHGKRPNAGGLK
jgi:hypothetical protein